MLSFSCIFRRECACERTDAVQLRTAVKSPINLAANYVLMDFDDLLAAFDLFCVINFWQSRRTSLRRMAGGGVKACLDRICLRLLAREFSWNRYYKEAYL